MPRIRSTVILCFVEKEMMMTVQLRHAADSKIRLSCQMLKCAKVCILELKSSHREQDRCGICSDGVCSAGKTGLVLLTSAENMLQSKLGVFWRQWAGLSVGC